MKPFIQLCTIILLGLTISSCMEKEEAPIARTTDYDQYLAPREDKALANCNTELAFWKNKYAQSRNSETYKRKIAGLLSARFALTGNIEDIKTSDSLYNTILQGSKDENASIHRAMAANCVTQHRFLDAYHHLQRALAIGEGKTASLYMLVDVNLELGDYRSAEQDMRKFPGKTHFPYMIRKAKMLDHNGNLDAAILMMEKAMVTSQDNRSLLQWTESNLADMYGHAGRIKEAYNLYLSILRKDPDYDYALKGIAWIAFSHDHNFAEARRIANYINSRRATPDMHLLLAEIAEAEKNQEEQNKQLAIFAEKAGDQKYGDMYNKYLALIASEQFARPAQTVALAEKEIHNRPTTQSYDLLAWGYFHEGNYKAALEVAEENIVDRTFEPDALYHLGMIYQANGKMKEGRSFLKQAAESSFELGPVIAEKIKEQLNRKG